MQRAQIDEQLGLTDSVGKLLTTRGVQTGPGAITLHLIFLGASSVAIPFVIVVIAPYSKSTILESQTYDNLLPFAQIYDNLLPFAGYIKGATRMPED